MLTPYIRPTGFMPIFKLFLQETLNLPLFIHRKRSNFFVLFLTFLKLPTACTHSEFSIVELKESKQIEKKKITLR